MVRIRCSQLEQIRRNPLSFAQILASGAPTSGGTHGMFAYWQDYARAVNKREETTKEAFAALQRTFLLKFNETAANEKKQEFLLDRFEPYCTSFQKNGFVYEESRKQIKWQLIPSAMLTGHTPLVANKKGSTEYVAYFFSEQDFDWSSELRFPLIQSYLQTNHYKHATSFKIGIYLLRNNSFELMSFSKTKIASSIDEAAHLFKKVSSEYEKLKA